jgi:uncharacterized repeat protein (TIGR03803 family)
MGTVFKVTSSGVETIGYNFKGSDGAHPEAGLVADSNANAYGTTSSGGAYSEGTVFEISSTGQQLHLYSFNTTNGRSDGYAPVAPLVFDGLGNLWGTTPSSYAVINGNTYEAGAVFKIGSGFAESVSYYFLGSEVPGDWGYSYYDGGTPESALTLGPGGVLYGTTAQGGGLYDGGMGNPELGEGTIFSLGSGEQPLFGFGNGNNAIYGVSPNSALAYDGNITFYGTTPAGGAHGAGTVYKSTGGDGITLLYTFGGAANNDGAYPNGVILDSEGNLYGTTSAGGSAGYNCGTIFKLAPAGGGTYTETILHNFTGTGGSTGDGGAPAAGLIRDSSGNLYGTTSGETCDANSSGAGTVFKYKP